MADPRRLIDDPEGSAFARSLIASANADAPSSESRARAARRLGVAAALIAGAGAGTEATAVAAVGKLAVVLLALGSAVGLAVWRSPPDPLEDRVALADVASPASTPQGGAAVRSVAPAPELAPVELAPPAVTPPTLPAVSAAQTPIVPPIVPPIAPPIAKPRAPSTARPARIVTPPAVAPSPVAPEVPELEVVAPPPEVVALPPAPPAPPAVVPAPITGPSRLAAEVALVDRARRELRAGRHAEALAALAEYHQGFPNGDLDAEADVVTIETLIATREHARARARGTAFLARFPRSPLAQRVRSLIDRLPN